MPCTFSAPLSEEQILDALDGDIPPDVAAHLHDCSECRARLEVEQAFQGRLVKGLFRIECPPLDKLRDYAFGLVSADLQKTVEDHLKLCRYCRHDLDEMKRFADVAVDALDLPAVDHLTPKWPLVPPHTLYGKTESLDSPRYRGLRGRGVVNGVMLEADGVSIPLEAALDDDNNILISGQFIVEDLEKWADALVEVWQEGRVRRFTSVDESGWFECDVDSIQDMRVVITNRDEQVIVFDDIRFPKQYGH